MADRTFNLNTQPHQAMIGDTVLKFEPEVIGSDFAEAYTSLQTLQTRVGDMGKPQRATSTKHAKDTGPAVDGQVLKDLSDGMRSFLRKFMLPESQTEFDGMRLPDRVLVELLEWVAELYGGGSGKTPAAGGTSTG